MKITVIFFLYCNLIFAQNKYEAFRLNDEYGIVDTSNLSEHVKPKYIRHHTAFSNVLCLMTNSYTDFYDKNIGFLKRFNQSRPELIHHKNETYFCYFDEENSYLIPHNYYNRIILPKRYIDLFCNKDYLICKGEGYFDVYEWGNFINPLISNVKAIHYVFRQLLVKNSDNIIGAYLFFGRDETFHFNDDFELVKTYEKVSEVYQLEKLLIKNYGIVEDVPKVSDYEPFIKTSFFVTDSNFMDISNEEGEEYKIKTNKKYDWSLYDEEYLVLHNTKRNEHYSFLIDFKNKKFLIPKEYQKTIGIKFIE